MKPLSWMSFGIGALALALLAGCGGGSPSGETAGQTESAGDTAAGPPTASIAPAEDPSAGQKEPLPQEGTPEWLVLEMTRLRVAKLAPTQQPLEDGTFEPVGEEESAKRLEEATRQRNRQIVQLAKEAIAKTFSDPDRERIYTAAVHHLTESRLQLALLGDAEDVKSLYNDARVLHERNPQSKAAAEAAFGLVRFAEANARQRVGEEPKWLKEFARQAQLFAVNFPQDPRGVAKLDAAGWSCEIHGMLDDALACYALIRDKYPDTPQAQYVAGVLRRLNLKGQPLMLAGPTYDGGYVGIDKLRGKVVLVAFWSAANTRFEADLPALEALAEKHKAAGFTVLGVNVDQDENEVAPFLERHGLIWPTIFHVDPTRRGWNGEAVVYYGVRNVPTYWLVDRNGVVAETLLPAAQLEPAVQRLLTP